MASFVPRELDFAETAPIIIESVGVVDGTRQEVWDTILDYERWPKWFTNIKTCRATSTPATGVGSTRVVTLGGGVAFDERFIAWDEPEVWAFTGISGPPIFAGLVERITLVELGPRLTEVTYRMAIEPRKGLGFAVKGAQGGVRKNLKKALRLLNTEVANRRPAEEAAVATDPLHVQAEPHDHPHDHDHDHGDSDG